MRNPRISRSQFLQIAVFLSFVLFAIPSSGLAKDPPSDLCALLPPAQLGKVLGQAYKAPEKSTAPPPYAANPAGTQCVYSAEKSGGKSVIFIVYVDPSTAVAKETFSKLSMFYAPATPAAGIGDTAYLDAKHAIHVLAGKVRYFISIPIATYTPENEKQLKDLATSVAGQL
jgi:hypothetical protein